MIQEILGHARGSKFESWLDSHLGEIEEYIISNGAVLFRDTGLGQSLQAVKSASLRLIGNPVDYREGVSPRVQVGAGMYSSTEYPSNLNIAQHNELSYTLNWPSRLIFYCVSPASEGGATPLADSRRVMTRLSCLERWCTSNIRYRRYLHKGGTGYASWPQVFGTSVKEGVEAFCRSNSIEFAWQDRGALVTEQLRPAIRSHPQTGEFVWFNQAHQWHPSSAGQDWETFVRSEFGEKLPLDAELGDGTPLSASDLTLVRRVYEDELQVFKWHAGDMLVLDNMLMSHGRQPYIGDRRIVVLMGGTNCA